MDICKKCGIILNVLINKKQTKNKKQQQQKNKTKNDGMINIDRQTDITLNEVRVVAALAQFHHDIEEGGDSHVRGRSLGEEGEITLQNGTIVLLLNHSQFNLHNKK